MNDSFLEELELMSKQIWKVSKQQMDCHVTKRATSSPLHNFSERDERDNFMQSQKECHTSIVPNASNVKIIVKEDSSKDLKKQSNKNVEKHSTAKISERIEKITDSKGKSVNLERKMDINKQQSVSGEHKTKLQEAVRLKVPENKIVNKDRNRRSGSHKETTHSLNTTAKKSKCLSDSSSNHSSDISSKENNRPSDFSKEASHNSIKDKGKLLDKSKKIGFKIQDQDPVTFLTAIKELVSTYTKQESTKILRVMQELHVNTQANLIKHLMDQTDDLVKEMHPSKESARVKALIEENELLQLELTALRKQNEDLQNKLQEFEFLKQENATLKSKCDELTQISR